MVRCTKCGTENKEDARYCTQCGAPLHPSKVRHEKYEKTETRDMCFGAAQSFRYFWLLVGIAIVLWGVFQLLQIYFEITLEVWPFILIAIGLYIIYRILARPQGT
jgi:uncharacterized membrane protein YvbJ